MCGQSSEAVFWDPLGMCGVKKAAFIPILSQLQARYKEGLNSKMRHHVFKSGYILIDDLMSAQSSIIHSVLLEFMHKIRKHPPDPYFCQEVVFGNVSGERPWNAVQKAWKKKKRKGYCYWDREI